MHISSEPRRSLNRPQGPSAHIEPTACVGSHIRRNARIDISFQGYAIFVSSSLSGAAAQLFDSSEPAVLEQVGGGRFLTSCPYEDGFGVWDFDGLTHDGVPTRLLTRRLLNRAT